MITTTPVHIPASPVKITYDDAILTLGSCFADNIGRRLRTNLFLVDANPFGVLYNPLSVKQSLLTLLSDKRFTARDLFAHQSLWHSFAHSSLFSDTTPDRCLSRINNRLQQSRERLPHTRFILITWGTAQVYRHNASGLVVANCHKLPARDFTRRRLGADEIAAEYRPLLDTLRGRLPGVRVIFTVSPIRHWKDGAHENNLSKATLLLAVDALQREYDFVEYFPAYELLLDELRDYRYYAEDMLHPSEMAANYIWERFADCYFAPDTRRQMKEIAQLVADRTHRPLHPESDAFRQFAARTEERQAELERKYPFLRGRLNGRE